MKKNSAKNYNTSENKSSLIRRVTWIGLLINVLLAIIKFIVGIFGNSQAVIADAIHSVSDMSTDFAVLIGVKYWESPADKDHPYGHKKIEAIVTLIIGLILGFVGIEIAYKAILSIPEPHNKNAMLLAALGPFVSIISKEILYRWTVKTGQRVKSTAVIANAWHHRSDALSSIPAFIAVLLASFIPSLAFVDHIGAIIVSLFILKVAFDIIKPAFKELTDGGASEKELAEIEKIALSVEGVKSLHKIRTRQSGGNYFVDLHIQVDGLMTVTQGHEISENVKRNLIQEIDEVIDVVVHLEPYK